MSGWRLLAAAVLAAVSASAGGETASGGIAWRPWSESVLAQARANGRLVLIDLTARWCTYCEKMKRVTYVDPGVQQTVAAHYLPVRIGDDEPPRLAARYAAYARPTSIVLDAEGRELIRKRGYLPPRLMTWMLQAVAEDPTAEAHR